MKDGEDESEGCGFHVFAFYYGLTLRAPLVPLRGFVAEQIKKGHGQDEYNRNDEHELLCFTSCARCPSSHG